MDGDEGLSGGRGNNADIDAEPDQHEVSTSPLRAHIHQRMSSWVSAQCGGGLSLFFLMQMLVAILCASMFNGWALNTDFADFLRASTDTSLRFDAVTQAWAQNSGGRRLQEKSWRHNVFNIVYYKENGNLLEEENLLAIRDFEHWLQASEAWTAACGMAVIREENFSAPAQYSCSPGESFVNFVWPRYGANGTDLDGVSVGPGEQQRLYLDGSGPRRFSVEVAIASFWDVPMKHQRPGCWVRRTSFLLREEPKPALIPCGRSSCSPKALVPMGTTAASARRMMQSSSSLEGTCTAFSTPTSHSSRSSESGCSTRQGNWIKLISSAPCCPTSCSPS
ncbi:unnamed protein product [Durusdinium trenchii]|uniref:Uncharacterized protein n=1 Tax=Durusdinium trenchii TaxID=1381693 RepID=A0ABP0IVA6_9DINO